MARRGVVVIPDVPDNVSVGQANFFRAVKEALEVLQGTHPKAGVVRRAATFQDLVDLELIEAAEVPKT